jgi:hypothetical protein
MGFLMPQQQAAAAPPPPPPPPPPANPPTYANSSVQAAGQGARSRMMAAAGAGLDNTLFTSPQGVGAAATPTTKTQLLGT